MMISMTIPGLPPSTNNVYFDRQVATGKGGKPVVKRILNDQGRKYKLTTSTYLLKNYSDMLKLLKPDIPLGLAIILDAPNLINKGWPKTAKSRYKKFDASNRIKLLEDAIAEACGIDDSNFVYVISGKRLGDEQTHIWIWDIDETWVTQKANYVTCPAPCIQSY